MNNEIENIINSTLKNLNDLTDTNKLISTKIDLENSNILAISKINVNIVIGGSDLDKKSKSIDLKPFAGATYVNFTLNPLLLVYEKENSINTINVDNNSTDLDSLFSNILSFVRKRKTNDEVKN